MAEMLRLRSLTAEPGEAGLAAMRALATAMEAEGVPVWADAAPPTEGAKGEGAVSGLLLRVADGALGKVMEIIAGLFSRPGAPPTELELETADGKARIRFDPRTLKAEAIPALVAGLAAGLKRG